MSVDEPVVETPIAIPEKPFVVLEDVQQVGARTTEGRVDPRRGVDDDHSTAGTSPGPAASSPTASRPTASRMARSRSR